MFQSAVGMNAGIVTDDFTQAGGNPYEIRLIGF